MSARQNSGLARASKLRQRAPVFAALGDKTRLTLLARLSDGTPCSISELADRTPISRQAITKHLQVLGRVGLVRGEMSGRERLFELDPKPLIEAKECLELVSEQWDDALSRLHRHLERRP